MTILKNKKKAKETIKDKLLPGRKFKIYWGKDNLNNKIITIVAIVDGDHVVSKMWSKRKRYYLYTVDDLFWFELLEEKGVIKRR